MALDGLEIVVFLSAKIEGVYHHAQLHRSFVLGSIRDRIQGLVHARQAFSHCSFILIIHLTNEKLFLACLLLTNHRYIK